MHCIARDGERHQQGAVEMVQGRCCGLNHVLSERTDCRELLS